jgi:hypothetical protein
VDRADETGELALGVPSLAAHGDVFRRPRTTF